jgi:hypothetical protein
MLPLVLGLLAGAQHAVTGPDHLAGVATVVPGLEERLSAVSSGRAAPHRHGALTHGHAPFWLGCLNGAAWIGQSA